MQIRKILFKIFEKIFEKIRKCMGVIFAIYQCEKINTEIIMFDQ